MKLTKKRITLLLGTAAAAATITITSAFALPQAVSAHGGPGGGPNSTYLAEALGVTTTELQAAQQKANEAVLAQAVAKGLITQAQADALAQQGNRGRGDLGRLGPWLGADKSFDVRTLTETELAEALDISVAKLQTAEQEAENAALAQAVTDGRITQEQADQMKAQQALRDYLDQQGFQDKVRSLYEQAIQDAVKAGVITQAQADQTLSAPGPGFGMPGFGGPGGRGGHGGRGFDGPGFGGPDGRIQGAPQSSTPAAPDTTPSNFSF